MLDLTSICWGCVREEAVLEQRGGGWLESCQMGDHMEKAVSGRRKNRWKVIQARKLVTNMLCVCTLARSLAMPTAKGTHTFCYKN